MLVHLILPGSLHTLSGSFVISENLCLKIFLQENLNKYYDLLFENNYPKSFILVFLNGKDINKINAVYLCEGDKIEIMTAISGG